MKSRNRRVPQKNSIGGKVGPTFFLVPNPGQSNQEFIAFWPTVIDAASSAPLIIQMPAETLEQSTAFWRVLVGGGQIVSPVRIRSIGQNLLVQLPTAQSPGTAITFMVRPGWSMPSAIPGMTFQGMVLPFVIGS